MLSLNASGEAAGILMKSFSVPCSPQRFSTGRSELPQLAATKEGFAGTTVVHALKYLTPCMILEQATSGMYLL